MLLTGTFRRSLDDKLRVAMPKNLKEPLAGHELFIAPGNDKALVVYTDVVLEGLGSYLDSVSPAARDARAFKRLFYSQAQRVELDKQGRMRIPPELASWSSLTEEVFVVGVRDRLEIWSIAAWEQFLGEAQTSYDELAEQVFEEARQNNRNG